MKKKEYKALVDFYEQAIVDKNNSLIQYEQIIRELRKEIKELREDDETNFILRAENWLLKNEKVRW